MPIKYSYPSIMKLYDSHFSHKKQAYCYYSDRELANLLFKRSELQNEAGHVLEIGSGIGTAKNLIEKQILYIDSDISINSLRVLKSIDKSSVGVCLNAEQLPFASKTFSAVLLIDVIEHCFDYSEVIKEVWRTLQPGGKFLIQTNNKFFDVVYQIFRNSTRNELIHPSVLTYWQLKRALVKQGFSFKFIVPANFSSFIISSVIKRRNLIFQLFSSLPTGFLHPALYPLFNVFGVK